MVLTKSERTRETRSRKTEGKMKRVEKIRALPQYECNLSADDWNDIYNNLTPDEQRVFASNKNLNRILKYCINGNYVRTDGLIYPYHGLPKPEEEQFYLHLYTNDGVVMLAPDFLTEQQLRRAGTREGTGKHKNRRNQKTKKRRTLH